MDGSTMIATAGAGAGVGIGVGTGAGVVGMAASSLSPTSPVGPQLGVASGDMPSPTFKRKRNSMTGMDSSPGSMAGDDDGLEPEKKRQPGVKRACNECRQQKLRCDVVQDPFTSCGRCNRLRLECKIESNFKRVGKRSKHAEMEKEIERLRRRLAQAKAQGFALDDDVDVAVLQSPIANSTYTHTRNPSLMGSDEAVSSLLNLKRGGSYGGMQRVTYELEHVQLAEENVNVLFSHFFTYYHRFLPFLNPLQSPEQYYQQHQLLFWSVIAVAARRYGDLSLTILGPPLTRYLWTTIGDVPNSYYVVKALCLLCTWPLPTSTSSTDPTHMLCGVMMKIATGIGLHRPNHIQDFSRVPVDLNSEQLSDRVTTWAVCNIVAQAVGTGYGQPASTLYDWTLAVKPDVKGPFCLNPELDARLQIERFSDKVSKEMYTNASDPRGVAGDEHRAILMRVYRREFNELQASIMSQKHGRLINLYLKAAALHFRLAGFFDSNTTPGYMDDLTALWRATTAFLDDATGDLDCSNGGNGGNGGTGSNGGGGGGSAESILPYATNYLQQMMVAAGFALMKLLGSRFSQSIDFARGRALFHRAVSAIRQTSAGENDIHSRLAELMVQVWNGYKVDRNQRAAKDEDGVNTAGNTVIIDDSLQLKVRCRHSMSLVFDSVWRWRDEFLAQGRSSLEALQNSTVPDSANESSASSTHAETNALSNHVLPPPPAPPPPPSGIMAAPNGNGVLAPAPPLSGPGAGPNPVLAQLPYGADIMDLFDPNCWALDGLLDFNFIGPFPQALEGT